MDESNLLELLDGLIAGWENEIVEFKQAGNDYSTERIGEYFSALANEANLRGVGSAWLVFGVSDKTRQVVGTGYRPQPERLLGLKQQIAQEVEPSVTFRAIHEFDHPGGRVIMMEIPPAPDGIPISWKGHYYARAGESLSPLGLDKLDLIRDQTLGRDWSAHIVPQATINDLDVEAVAAARRAFARKHEHRFTFDEVTTWPVQVFTDRVGLTRDGQVTRAALLLLGKPEVGWFLSPHPAELTWSLLGENRDYEHFTPPFLLATTALFARIRNLKLRLVQPGTLMQLEVNRYDERTVLEGLHNAIAHQDYRRNGRVLVQEFPDHLVISNEGSFFDGQPDDYLTGQRSPRRYRNPLLAQTMVQLGMIDRLGYGIFDMHQRQAHRFLPMPDYDLTEPDAVKLTIYGAVVDEAYTRLLMTRADLPLTDVLALDRVQKHLPIPEPMTRRLRRAGLIEGRKPHVHVVPVVVPAATVTRVVLARDPADRRLMQLIVDHLLEHESATRTDIDALLNQALPAELEDEAANRKIANLITMLRRNGYIHNTGSRANPVWMLTDQLT